MWNDYAGLPPFRRCDAAQHGLSDADVRRLLKHGVLVRLAHGLLVGYRRTELATEPPDQLVLRIQAMRRRYPSAVGGMRSAAALEELWLVGPSGPVHLLRARGHRREKRDVWVESASLPPDHLTVVRGVEVTSVARTTVDLVGRLPCGEALAVADSALRLGTGREDLAQIMSDLGHDHDGLVAEVLGMADPRADTALESMSRWIFHEAHLPPPEPQVVIGDDDGPFARVDFLWRDFGVIGESDGMKKYDQSSETLRAEKRRQERLERMGFIVVRWGFDDVVVRKWETVRRIRNALDRGAAREAAAM